MILTISVTHEALSAAELFDVLYNVLPVPVELIQLLLIFVQVTLKLQLLTNHLDN